MKCIGCERETQAAAYAIMHVDGFAALGVEPSHRGPHWPDDPGRRFGAAGVCKPCFVDPAHRKRALKAHFAEPGGVDMALAAAGSHGNISMS